MTNSQVKKAIDETIGEDAMMNEAYVQKILHGKKRRKKPIPFLQPVIVVLLMFTIGGILYFIPEQSEQAVEIESEYLAANHEQLIADFYGAINQHDKKALAKVSLVNSEQAFIRYSIFDFKKPIEVIKTIETEEAITLFIRLQTNDSNFLEELIINKETVKIELDMTQPMGFYEVEAELPKEFTLEYKVAPYAPVLENIELDLEEATVQTVNGHTLYQIPTDEGIWRVFETPGGERFDLNIASDGPTQFITGNNQQFFFVDSETIETTYIYRNDKRNYQIVTGELESPHVMTFASDFHDEPVLFSSGSEPKVITTKQGQLIYANIFEHANLINPSDFYHAESIGKHLLVEYTEDLKQISTYYQFTAHGVLMDYSKIGMLEAKPEHFTDMSLAHRYNDQLIYTFNKDKIYYGGRSLAGELVEEQYTNIQIKTKDNQYFITGDDGFSWTLTRIAPRILVDEKGIEYIIPFAFEDMPQISDVLLDDEIQSMGIYKIGGIGTYAYILEEDLDKINELFSQATVNDEYISLGTSDFMIDIEYKNGKRERLELWLKERDQESFVMKNDVVSNTITLFKIPAALADRLRKLADKIEEIDNSK
ncbi:hypothetical protein ACTHOQ_06690 [Solibacillus silvestris]|uniref:hypothetical protein n=1 Tax=Solibacillus silvestris TaxID=76853 RepID=UPI003F7D6058